MPGRLGELAIGVNALGEVGEGNVVDTPVDLYGSLIDRDAVWLDLGAPLQLMENTLTVNEGVGLEVRQGVQVQVPETTFLEVYGALRLLGRADDRIVFTSESGRPGSWQGLYLYGEGSELRFADVVGAGAPSWYLPTTGAAITLRARG
jgi:hypothetical protein